MTVILDLYTLAEDEEIPVYWFNLDTAESPSYLDEDGDCHIAINPWYLRSVNEEKMKLAHELGHCITGSFYNRWATCDIRQKHENRANRWAYKKLIPEDELAAAIRQGYREPWELAEYFDVTEEFLRRALEYYYNQA